MVLAVGLFSIMDAMVKWVGPSYPTFEIVFFRSLSVANSYSRGDREFEKATAMLFPSKVARRGRMSDHTAGRFRRRVTV